jgi:O-antigen ligase
MGYPIQAMSPFPAMRALRTAAARLPVVRWVNAVGLVGLFLFAFGVFFKDRTANAGIAMMATAFLVSFRKASPGLLKDPLPIWGSFFFLFVCMRAASALIHFDADPALVLNRMVLYGCVFLLVFLVAFWMHQVDGQWQWVFLALVTGFLAQIIRKGEWASFFEVAPLYWSGLKRAGFGSPVNRFALWSAIVLLVCALLHGRFWEGPAGKVQRWIRSIFWGFMCTVSAMGVVFAQSRAAWLASAIVFPSILFNRFCKTRRHKLRAIALLAVAVTGLALLTNFPAVFSKRVLADIEAGKAVVGGAFDRAPDAASDNVRAVYERLLLYQFFLEKWMERPALGYGPGASEILLSRAAGQYAQLSQYDHVHNTVFDIMLRFGFIGCIMYAGGVFIVVRQLIRGKRQGAVELDYYYIAAGGLGLMVICAMFAQPMNTTKGLYAFGLLGGICYASRFKRSGDGPTPDQR